MSLFPSANDFKSGPGVEKDAPRKTGVGRFFELVGRDMSGMFLANLLTCLGFLPVICLVYIGFLMNSLPVMVLSAAVGRHPGRAGAGRHVRHRPARSAR